MTQETNRASVARLADRGTVRVSGPDAPKFLQGLVTNDVEGLVTSPDDLAFAASTAHAAILSPQGKILFEFFCVRTPDGFVLDVLREKAPELVKRLSMYKLRTAVEIKDVSEDYTLLALWGPNACSSGPAKGTIALYDPRHAELGQRILAQAQYATDIASATNGFNAPPEAYHAHRIALGVPEGGKDYDFGDTYPHEANFDLLNGVSFTKGCYVGQEIVARMQHKTVVRKRVVRVGGQSDLTQGTEIKHRDVSLGRIGSVDGFNALALIRLDRFVEALASDEPIVANGVPIAMKTEDLRRYLDTVATRDKA